MNKKTNSFKLLWEAVKSSRQSMWISIQVLVVITFVLATIFYLAESGAQSEEYNYWNSLVWAFTRYIDDPGEFASIAPVTVTGRWMATLIGIVGILIFAVPAGLIGGAFTSAIEDDLREKHLEEIGERLRKAFRRVQDKETLYRTVPRYISLGTIQAMKEMTERDVIDAVRYNPPFRLRNLATAAARGRQANDQLVIEMFPLNTAYGVCVDRHSNVTIVCPTAESEAGIGNFSYHLALIGGFNYVSKEVKPNIDEPDSFYFIDKDESSHSEDKKTFLKDLKRVAGEGEDKWVIIMIESRNYEDLIFQFQTKAYPKTGRESTILNEKAFSNLWKEFESVIDEDFCMKSNLNILKPAGEKNLAIRLGGGEYLNAFTIRVSSEFSTWNPFYLKVAQRIAIIINSTIGEPDYKITEKLLKEQGYGFQGIDFLKKYKSK